MQKKVKRIVCIIMSVAVMLGATCVSAFGASGESCTSITGSTAKTKVFKVEVTPKTYGYDYIKLSHYAKGKYRYEYKVLGVWTANHHTKNAYGYYKITIKDPAGNTVKTLNWENSKSITVKFGSWFKYKGSQFANNTYTIYVTPYTKTQMRKVAHYGYENWINNSKWKVYKTRGVGGCW